MRIEAPHRQLSPGSSLTFEVVGQGAEHARVTVSACSSYGHTLTGKVTCVDRPKWTLELQGAPGELYEARAKVSVKLVIVPRRGEGAPSEKVLPVYLTPSPKTAALAKPEETPDDHRDSIAGEEPAPTGEPAAAARVEG